jgi:hypothetical protein
MGKGEARDEPSSWRRWRYGELKNALNRQLGDEFNLNKCQLLVPENMPLLISIVQMFSTSISNILFKTSSLDLELLVPCGGPCCTPWWF